MSATAFSIIKLIGVAYLLYLAWSIWQKTGALRIGDKKNNAGALGIGIEIPYCESVYRSFSKCHENDATYFCGNFCNARCEVGNGRALMGKKGITSAIELDNFPRCLSCVNVTPAQLKYRSKLPVMANVILLKR